MALNQITYTDKVENSGATDDGKVLAVDMNEIKSVTNDFITDYEANLFNEYLDGYMNDGRLDSYVGDLDLLLDNGSFVCAGVSVTNEPPFTNNFSFTVHTNRSSLNGNYGNQIAISVNSGNGEMFIRSRDNNIYQPWREVAMADDFVQATNSTLGTSAGSSITTETNATCLGNNAQVTASSQVQLGNSSTTTYAYGAVQDRSDERDKADIQDVHLGLDFIEALTPRSYKFDYREDYREHTEDEEGNFIPDTRQLGDITHDGTHKRSRLHCGLVAQEVKQVMDDLGVDFAGYQDHSLNGGQDVLSIGYGELIAPMIKAIQELKARVEALEGA